MVLASLATHAMLSLIDRADLALRLEEDRCRRAEVGMMLAPVPGW